MRLLCVSITVLLVVLTQQSFGATPSCLQTGQTNTIKVKDQTGKESSISNNANIVINEKNTNDIASANVKYDKDKGDDRVKQTKETVNKRDTVGEKSKADFSSKNKSDDFNVTRDVSSDDRNNEEDEKETENNIDSYDNSNVDSQDDNKFLNESEENEEVIDDDLEHEDMADVYIISETKALKVTRRYGDMLKSCEVVELSLVASNDELIKVKVKEITMGKMATLCDEAGFSAKNRKKRFLTIIYEGTKWCGAGDSATDDDDLGKLKRTDACCRTHDKCDPSIAAFETKYNITNYAIWSKSHCKCDSALYRCLKKAAKKAAKKEKVHADYIGTTFFNTLSVGCIKEVYPLTCVATSWIGTCTKYRKDKSQPKRLDFVENKLKY